MTHGSSDSEAQPPKADRLERVERLTERNALAIAQLTSTVTQLAIDADTDRKMILASLEQHDVVLARIDRVLDENQQILNYLFGQQRGNGHSGSPPP